MYLNKSSVVFSVMMSPPPSPSSSQRIADTWLSVSLPISDGWTPTATSALTIDVLL